jgi:hypothetical protein
MVVNGLLSRLVDHRGPVGEGIKPSMESPIADVEDVMRR